jgi:hypothetical protein
LPPKKVSNARNATRWIELLEKFGVLFFLFVLIAFFAFQNQRFLSLRNIFNILADVSLYGVMAVGMTFVILTGVSVVGERRLFRCTCPTFTKTRRGRGPREMTTEPVHLDHGQSPRREEADRYLMAQDKIQ